MPWYRTGTVSVTNGSTTVTGSGTNWIDGAAVGEAFIGPDAKVYEIASIVSATQITLATAYQGTTQTGQPYQIVPSQSYIRDLAAQAAALVSNYGTAMTTAGQGAFGDGTVSAPGVRFTADGDTGLRRVGTNSFALVAGGADRLTVDTAGVSVTGNLSVYGTLTGNAARVGALADGTNLNTVVDPGFYRIQGNPVNAPEGVAYGQLIVARGVGDSILQIATGYANGEIYWRQGNPPETGGRGWWNPWRRFWHEGNLADAFKGANQSLSGYGYQKLPGGLIMQWGTTLTAPTDGYIDTIFPIAFPTSCVSVVAQQTFGVGGGGGVAIPGWTIPSKTSTGFRLNNDAVDQVFHWIAIGY